LGLEPATFRLVAYSGAKCSTVEPWCSIYANFLSTYYHLPHRPIAMESTHLIFLSCAAVESLHCRLQCSHLASCCNIGYTWGVVQLLVILMVPVHGSRVRGVCLVNSLIREQFVYVYVIMCWTGCYHWHGYEDQCPRACETNIQRMSRYISVLDSKNLGFSIASGPQTGLPRTRGSITVRTRLFIFSVPSRPALGTTYLPVWWVPGAAYSE
jgi:hypothetical protein